MSVAHSNVGGLLRKHGYIELKKVGEGSFGKALLVRSEDGQRLICKMVDVSKATRREMEDAVKEGKLLSDLKHPYIVRYRESFTESGWLCILMDYCEGGDLTARITEAKRSRKPLAEDQILRWFAQAILALKYIHEKHVLHRDLKPSNFFLSKSGNLKMGDFGIAKVLACTIAVAKTQIGTPYYLSPELCQEKPYTFSSEIWAMGCILYELCALRVPFDAPNIPGLVQKITKAPVPTVPATYSSFLRELVGQMLNRNADRRPSPEEILQKPQLQGIVKQMLDEAQEAVQAVDDGVQQAHSEQAAVSASPSAPSAVPSSVGGDRAGGFRGAVPSQMGRSPSWGGVGPSGPGSRPGSRGGSPLPLQRRSPALAAGAIAGLGSQPGSRAASPSNRVSGAAQLEAYRKHDLVDYWSVSHGDWLPATVTNVDMEGRIVIDLKPNTWLTKEDQATKVRRRARAGTPGGLPSQIRRTPSAAGAIAGLGSQPGSRAASPSNRVSGAAQLEAYRKHDLVDYWSVSHGDWLPATVMNVDMEGRIVIDLKPNTWLTKEDQATKVRRRARAGTPGGLPSQIRRTPSADHLGVRAPSPRCVPSPGRAMSPHRAASPFRPSIDAPFRVPSPRRRDAPTPRRSVPGIPPAGGPSLGDSPLRAGGANVACGYIP